MKVGDYYITKHVINRIMERLILSQNIKLNKKQKSRLRKKTNEIIKKDLYHYFAVGSDKTGEHKFLYTDLDKNYMCKKYIISNDLNSVLTVVLVDFRRELKKFNLFFTSKRYKITKKDFYFETKYLYTKISDFLSALFVVGYNNNNIYSLKFIEGDIKC